METKYFPPIVVVVVSCGRHEMSSSTVCIVAQLLGSRIKLTDGQLGLWLLLENLDNLVMDDGNMQKG